MVFSPLRTEDLTSWREMFLGRHLMGHKSIIFQIISSLIDADYLLRHKNADLLQEEELEEVMGKRAVWRSGIHISQRVPADKWRENIPVWNETEHQNL